MTRAEKASPFRATPDAAGVGGDFQQHEGAADDRLLHGLELYM